MSGKNSRALLACLTVSLFGLASGARAADSDKGKAVFERCSACHSLDAGKNDEAPTLSGIFGRKAAIEDFRYSAAMKRSDVTWDEKSLDSFLDDPQGFIPGNRMPFEGLKDKTDRDNLIEYLKTATKKASSELRAWPSVLQVSANASAKTAAPRAASSKQTHS
jgi:cytochrome c2